MTVSFYGLMPGLAMEGRVLPWEVMPGTDFTDPGVEFLIDFVFVGPVCRVAKVSPASQGPVVVNAAFTVRAEEGAFAPISQCPGAWLPNGLTNPFCFEFTCVKDVASCAKVTANAARLTFGIYLP
jgi:hypothetical protein